MNTLRVRVHSRFTLGDTVALTAAVRDLRQTFPGRFRISVDTGFREIWQFNPHICDDAGYDVLIDCGELEVDKDGRTGRHYLEAYTNLFNRKLGTSLRLSRIGGDIHLSDQERHWYSDIWSLCGREIPFWIICPGGKHDIPIKWWDWRRYQEVVDALRGKIQFVQIGAWGNYHPPLEGVIDLRGKTSVRDLIHLVYNADGVFCGVTALMHLAAAVPPNPAFQRSAVIIGGAREPRTWEAYPDHVFFSTGDQVSCAHCWREAVRYGNASKRCLDAVRDLPRCMDLITSGMVIDAFLDLHRAGRALFLTRRDLPFARIASRKARRRSDFDEHNIHEQNAAAKAAEFLARIPPCPEGRFSGRGIVICAGGHRYFPLAWVCIRMLRQHGCTLPIEVWHYGKEELDSKMAALLAPLGVRCVNALEVMQRFPMRNALGYELKCYAVLHCQFEEVISLDADNVPLRDPEFLFRTPQYLATGAIFWPDYGQLQPRRKIWKLCGVAWRPEPEFESGQMVIHKRRCWHALNLAWWYNDHSEFFYRYIHGDKDTFHMAWRCTGTNYSMIPFPIQSLEGVMCQHDFEGRRLFQHRNSHKWSFCGSNRRIPGFLLEEDCLRHLEDLRELWDGTVNGRAATREVHGMFLREGTSDAAVFNSVAVGNEYRLPGRIGPDEAIIDVGTHIGSFIRACWERGARSIYGFEPHPENFALARRNVRSLDGVKLKHAAVLHREMRVRPEPFPREETSLNTGGAAVFEDSSGAIKALALDSILRKLGSVTLLKLDCEGSEWPLLMYSREWKRVAAICGEYHCRGSHPLCPDAGGPLDGAYLRALLRRHFRFVKTVPDPGGTLGKFWASHDRNFFLSSCIHEPRP